ncbi:MAG: integrase core domain-containing protein [Pseudomonadales bacterium]|nr:integrase core domain-containing protein [Pseudomonadales bacterium]
MEQLFQEYGRPACIRSDNGTELVSQVVQKWLAEYNTIRPHGSLGGLSPEQFLQGWAQNK